VNKELQKLKQCYIPLYANGAIGLTECAQKIGITTVSVWRLAKRYKKDGAKIFIHGHTGKPSHNLKLTQPRKNNITDYYKNSWFGAPYQVFYEYVLSDLKEDVSYTAVTYTLNNAGYMSPKAHKPKAEKKKHLPREERPCEGELLQLDGCKHDWFMNKHKTVIHGMIDDATHKPTALYMCENECLLGYQEALRRTNEKYGGFPEAVYSDRSSIFCVTKESLEKVSIQEQLAGIDKSETQWQKMCEVLNIQCIFALSPEAKGRIERLWETLQGRLPYIFRFLGINTIEAANEFLSTYIDIFNEQFSVDPQSDIKKWHKAPENINYDYLMSVKSEKTVKSNGTFCYHGEKFYCKLPLKKVTLCLNERFGLKIFYQNKWYDVELYEPLQDTYSDTMPIVEKELIRRYFYADTHSNTYKMREYG